MEENPKLERVARLPLYLPSLEDILMLRKIIGLTQAQVAEKTGVSQSLISKMEKGIKHGRGVVPSYQTVKKLYEFYIRELRGKNEIEKIPCAGELMTSQVVYVAPDDPVKKAFEIMKNRGFSQIPVLDGKKNAGTITESCAYTLLLDKTGKRALDEPVKNYMEKPLPAVNTDAAWNTVAEVLERHPAVLVSKSDGGYGIITKANFIEWLMSRETKN
ncbi:MAG: CBS domain-containing protein [Thermoplasmata archaeon]|nr:CBS domain-containing protein [Thermoplasmata archaeon]